MMTSINVSQKVHIPLGLLLKGHAIKKQKLDQMCPIMFGEINTRRGKPKPESARILFDSGASSTIIHKEIVNKLCIKDVTPTEWTTAAGKMQTHQKTKVQFKLNEFDDNKIIEWSVHMMEKKFAYDMIIG